MEMVYQRSAGLDIHRRTVVACVRVGLEARPVRTFAMTTDGIEQLIAWLCAEQVEMTLLESTGVYWKPVFNLLEGAGLATTVVNPAHLKVLAGRKTDRLDAAWLAEVAQFNLVRASFIPDRATRELRELVRYRGALVAARTAEVNHIHALLAGAEINTKLVASDILGVAGRAILDALAGGESDAARLAALGEGRLRTNRSDREAALRGTMGEHQRWLLATYLRHIDYLNGELTALNGEITTRLAPHADALARLDTIPGVGSVTAEVIVSELGTDMGRFPTAAHAASWAGLSPGQHESGGKRRRARTRKGNRWLRTALVEAAQAAGRSRGTVLGQQYQRLAPRLGAKRAAVALARKILVIAYHILRDGGLYREPGPRALPATVQAQRRRRAVRQLQALGFTVTLTPVGAAP